MNEQNLYYQQLEDGDLKRESDYREIVEQLHNTQEELDYWHKLAKSYERTILKLCTALAEEKDGAERE